MRRSLFLLLSIPVGAIAALSLLGSGKAPEPERAEPAHDWVLVYYMSYDNNLDQFGPVILDALEKGVKESKLVVTVLSDDIDRSGLKRYTITSRGRTKETLKSDNSASEELVSEYLAWVARTYPARHYAIVFLNHGGRLDEMCMDERPGKNEGKRWLSARLVGLILREFRNEVPGEVDLLFLQQCGRGSLENLYNFRGAAVAIMASQMNVGAPNTYYEDTLKWLTNQPEPSGLDLARQIMSSDEHFGTYACVDGGALAELPARIEPVIEALLGNRNSKLKTAGGQQPCYIHELETFYDALEWLENAFHANDQPTESLDHFKKWMREKLIVARATHPRFRERLDGWSGLSLWVPESETVRGKYSDYPIYQDCRLDDLWSVMYPQVNPERGGSQ